MSKIEIPTKRCVVCKNMGTVEVNLQEYNSYANGINIQEAMPSADADTREQILTGTHKECWEKLFGKEE